MVKTTADTTDLLQFVYEDDDIFVINKPSGIHSVALEKSSANCLATLLLQKYPTLAGAAPKAGDAGLVQRLDFETSGLIVGAKSREIWEKLAIMLQQGKVKKSYLALVEGILARPQKVSGMIGAAKRRAKKVRVYKDKNVKRSLEANTSYRPVRIFRAQECTLVRALAPTARRHQIRAHAASIEHPLIGDALYGSKRTLASIHKILAGAPVEGQHFLLHAATLEFPHPRSGARLTFEIGSRLLGK